MAQVSDKNLPYSRMAQVSKCFRQISAFKFKNPIDQGSNKNQPYLLMVQVSECFRLISALKFWSWLTTIREVNSVSNNFFSLKYAIFNNLSMTIAYRA